MKFKCNFQINIKNGLFNQNWNNHNSDCYTGIIEFLASQQKYSKLYINHSKSFCQKHSNLICYHLGQEAYLHIWNNVFYI